MSPSAASGLAEIVLWQRNLDAAMRFYGDLLGMQVISPPDLPMKFLSCGEGPGGVPQMIVLAPHPEPDSSFPAEKTGRVLHHLALSIDPSEYEALKARFMEEGLEVRDGVHPVLKDVQTFYVDDPEGNEVELIAKTG